MKGQTATLRLFACTLFILCMAQKCQDPPGTGVLLVGIESLPVEGTELEGLDEIRINVQEVRVVHRTDPDDPSTEELITIDAEEHELVFPLEEGVPTEVARFYVPEGHVYQRGLLVLTLK